MNREWWADGPEAPDELDARRYAREQRALDRFEDREIGGEPDFYKVYPRAGLFSIFGPRFTRCRAMDGFEPGEAWWDRDTKTAKYVSSGQNPNEGC